MAASRRSLRHRSLLKRLLEHLERLERLGHPERLEHLERLERRLLRSLLRLRSLLKHRISNQEVACCKKGPFIGPFFFSLTCLPIQESLINQV